jgi:hypothetical protein
MAKKQKKAKAVKTRSLEKHIAACEKALGKLRATIEANQTREAAMVVELADLVGQLPKVVENVIEDHGLPPVDE